MKLKKTKLTAVLMSALMAASTMSPLVYAEEDVAIICEDEAVAEDVTAEVTEEVAPADDAVVVEEVAPVEQAEEVAEAAADASDTSTPEDGAYVIDEKSIIFHYTAENPTMKVTYKLNWVVDGTVQQSEDKEATATVNETKNPTCVDPGQIQLKVKIGEPEKTYFSAWIPTSEKALGHDYEAQWSKETVKATHMQAGKMHIQYKCNRCSDTYETDEDLPQQEHTWADEYSYYNFVNIKTDENGEYVPGEDGLPQLDDVTKPGSYDRVIRCTEYGKLDIYGNLDKGRKKETIETIEIPATTGIYAKITSWDKLAEDWDWSTVAPEGVDLEVKVETPTTVFPLDNDKIELANCDTAGWYIVSYYHDGDGAEEDNWISDEKIVVTPHHMLARPIVEFSSEDDMNQCTVVYNEDGSYTVTNHSCYLPVTYKEVSHCTAAGCPKKLCDSDYVANLNDVPAVLADVEHTTTPHNPADKYHFISSRDVVAEPAGEHVIDRKTEKAINKAVENGATYEVLQGIVKDNEYVVVSNDTSTCTEDGTATVEYRCMVCYRHEGTVVKTVTVDVTAKGHTGYETGVRKNYEAPTCTEKGSYDLVHECTRCGEEILESRHVIIPRLPHTNELSVNPKNGEGVEDTDDTKNAAQVFLDPSDPNAIVVAPFDNAGFGYEVGDEAEGYIGFNYPYVNLGVWFVPTSKCDVCGYEVEINKDPKITVKDVKNETPNGKPGSITLEVSYTNPNGDEHKEEFTFVYFSCLANYQSRVENIPLNGLHKEADGSYKYYVDDVFQEDFFGIVKYDGEEFFVSNGVADIDASGLNMFDGKWYYLARGRICREKTGLVPYDGHWFYIVNGELNTAISGLIQYDGGVLLIKDGRYVNEARGLWRDFDGTWYFLANGAVQFWYNGVAEYDGGRFVVENGIYQNDYNGTIEFRGSTYNVVGGQLFGKVA